MAIKSAISDEPPKECGARHPRYKSVTCVRIGECANWMPHMGIVTNPNRLPDEQRKFVYWGGRSMEQDRDGPQ